MEDLTWCTLLVFQHRRFYEMQYVHLVKSFLNGTKKLKVTVIWKVYFVRILLKNMC